MPIEPNLRQGSCQAREELGRYYTSLSSTKRMSVRQGGAGCQRFERGQIGDLDAIAVMGLIQTTLVLGF